MLNFNLKIGYDREKEALKDTIRAIFEMSEFTPSSTLFIEPTAKALFDFHRKYHGDLSYFVVVDRVEVVACVRFNDNNVPIVNFKFYPFNDNTVITSIIRYARDVKEWQSVLVMAYRIAAAIQNRTVE